MKKSILTSSIALLLLSSLIAGCGEKASDSSKSTPQKEQLQNQASNSSKDSSTPESEKQAATEAVKQYLKAQGSIDYTDPSAYKAPEKYVTPSFAKSIQKNEQTKQKAFKENQVTASVNSIEAKFISQQKDQYLVEGKAVITYHSKKENRSIGTSGIDENFVLVKDPKGAFLINEISKHSAK